MKFKLILNGLNCAHCTKKIEDRVAKIEGVTEAIINFSTSVLTIEVNDEKSKNKIIDEIKSIVKSIEPNVRVEKENNSIKTSSNCINNKSCTRNCNSYSSDKFNKKILNYINDNSILIIGVIIYVIALIYSKNQNLFSIALFGISYIVIGGDVILLAIRNIFKGEVFDENFLMSIATIGAFLVGEYPEAVAVMLFYQIGEIFQGYAVNKSRKSISSLMDIRADYANVLRNNSEIKVSPEEVIEDEVIIIKPGERVPLDGIVLEGSSFIDTSALTGESVPREVSVNDEILSGSINDSGVLKVKVKKRYGESTVARILDLVENASSKKAPTEKFITKFARVYTPIVVIVSVLVAIIPPFIIKDATFSEWIYKALSILVVSCPCALVVSIPLGCFSGIGAASKKGILVKGGNYLEALKDSEIIVFDKTGTLTKGVFNVVEINPIGIDKESLLELAATAEVHSNHPISISIKNAYAKKINTDAIIDYKEISGQGIEATIKGNHILIGNDKLMKSNNIKYQSITSIGTVIYIAINKEYKGNIVISDEIKVDIKESLRRLKDIGIKKIIMLTGDNRDIANKVAQQIGIDEFYAELLPNDKVNIVEQILSQKSKKGKVLFVGDGINDAPVIARADIGVAMGGIGSDAAIEAADVVLMKDKIEAIEESIKISKKTNKILWENIIFSLGIKLVVMILVVLGLTNMWVAVFADVGVTLIAIINSMRIIR